MSGYSQPRSDLDLESSGRALLQNDSEIQQQKTRLKRTLYFVMVIALALAITVIALGVSNHNKSKNSEPVASSCQRAPATGYNGMVSTTNLHATNAGLEILKAGGNAFDAAAAVQFMLALTQPQSTGIGGGCFVMMYKADTQEILALDGREETPERFNSTSFCKNPQCVYDANCDCSEGVIPYPDIATGGHPVGVPGTVAAMNRMLSEHGTMKLADVMKPAIQKAEHGFPMYEELHKQITLNKGRLSYFKGSRDLFLSNNGEPVPIGHNFVNKDFANTLRIIAEKGADAFYRGEIAKDILHTVQNSANPNTTRFSPMQAADLESYRPVYRQPLNSTYRDDYLFYGMNMPSSGAASLAQMMGMLELFRLDMMESGEGEFLHRIIDAQDIAFADRGRYMGDADFVDVPVAGMLDKTYVHGRAKSNMSPFQSARPSNGKVPAGVPPGADDMYADAPENPRHGTTHLVVVDKWGNVVSMTTTIEENMGAALVVPGRGFLLNNELTDFEVAPVDPATGKAYANGVQGGKRPRRSALGADATSLGGKRPLSSMTPTIIMKNFDGKWAPYLAIGSPGGSRIIGQVMNTIVYALDSQMCITDAIDQPRVISRNDGAAEVEQPLLKRTEALKLLRQRQFDINELITARPLGYVEAVMMTPCEKCPNGRLLQGGADEVRMPSALAAGF